MHSRIAILLVVLCNKYYNVKGFALCSKKMTSIANENTESGYTMFNKTKPVITETNTVIGDGITIESSKITGAGSIRINGRLIGELDIDGNLIIGETGYVKGDIKVNHVLIAGKMDGNAYCRAGIRLAPTAELNGNIKTTALVIDEGAKFTGSSLMNTIDENTETSALVFGFNEDAKSGEPSDTNKNYLGNGERNLLQRIRSDTYEENPDA